MKTANNPHRKPYLKHSGSLLALISTLLTSYPLLGEEDRSFAVVGKKVVYAQTSPSEMELHTLHMESSRYGAYVFISNVDGSPASLTTAPGLSWSQSSTFYDLHPDVTYQRHGDEETVEWELDWSTNSPEEYSDFFPPGTYTLTLADQQTALELPASDFPAAPLITVTGSGQWRLGSFVQAEGEGLELSVTLPDWDEGIRVADFEIWGPMGTFSTENRINRADFLEGLAPPYSADPTLRLSIPAESLQISDQHPFTTYTIQVLYTRVVDSVLDQPGILGLSIVETAVRVELIIARNWSYAQWVQMEFAPEHASDPDRSGPTVVFINDGITNLMKYATGMRPWRTVWNLLPVTIISNGPLLLSFNQRLFSDLNYIVEVSSDLLNWHSGPGYTEEMDRIPNLLLWDKVTVADTTPLDSPMRFIRLRVQSLAPGHL